MKKIKIGIVGLGSMGTAHRLAIESLDDFELAAICDIEESKLKDFKDRIPCFTDYPAMLAEAALDAVTVATPHWFHPEIGAAALDAGKHVLIEKPIGVHVSHARKLLDAIARHPELKAAAMFNQRRIEAHRRLKSLIDGGELGKILRINWIITDWFRTQRYYDSGDWRASWRGEGGGVLINQCPHQLDLMQWFFGMPERVTAFMSFGKYHRIEVEDEVTAYLEYPVGATGVFVTSTGEAPRTDRLGIAAGRGRVRPNPDRNLCVLPARGLGQPDESARHARYGADSDGAGRSGRGRRAFQRRTVARAAVRRRAATGDFAVADCVDPAIHGLRLPVGLLRGRGGTGRLPRPVLPPPVPVGARG